MCPARRRRSGVCGRTRCRQKCYPALTAGRFSSRTIMRIGISTSVIQRGKTGIAQYLFGLLRALREGTGGHEFFLFVLAEDLPFFEFAKGMQIISVPERFRSPGRDIWWHQTKLPALARSLRLDVLHVPSYRRLLWPKPCPLVA